MNNSRIITAPDLDLDERFKILLVDVEWTDVEQLSQTIGKLGIDITMFLYGSKNNDDAWAVNTHKHCHSTLINLRFSGSKEILKGWMLAQKNTYGLGSHFISDSNHRTVYDLYSWFATQYDNYLKQKEETNG